MSNTVFNPFRILADLTHLVSVVILLDKIRRHKNCAGVSFKTQFLLALVFTTRYLDIFTNTYSLYNTILKGVFLAASYYTLYLMTYKHAGTMDRENDIFQVLYLIIPCAILGFIFSADHTSILEILWTFSIILESVVILPQILMLQRTGEVENITANYIVALGAYRGIYMLNWVYRYLTEENYSAWLVWIFGTLQTALYVDFFYYYARSKVKGEKLVLPA